MEWERAKNIILIAFIFLNLGLAGLLYLEDSRYTLTPDRIRNMHTVLSNNNIILYTNPMRRFAPMRHLDITGYYYDIPEILNIFFGDEPVYQYETEEGHPKYETANAENGSLEISNGYIYFDNHLQNDIIEEIPRTVAVGTSDAFINEHFPDFVRDIVFEEYGGVHIIYCQEYRGQLIQSNVIEFFITSQGIEWIEMRYGRVIGYDAEPRMIFAPDEILLTFMQRVRHEAAENRIFIRDIDIVYLQEFVSDQEGSVYPAIPFYRIFVQHSDFPFLINAYTNEFLD